MTALLLRGFGAVSLRKRGQELLVRSSCGLRPFGCAQGDRQKSANDFCQSFSCFAGGGGSAGRNGGLHRGHIAAA